MTRQTDDELAGPEVLAAARAVLDAAGPGAVGAGSVAAAVINLNIQDHGAGSIGGTHHHYGSKVVEPSWPVLHGLPEPAGAEVVARLDVTEPIVDKLLGLAGTDQPEGDEQGASGLGSGVVGVSATAGLRGAGGFGKTTAARVVVHDPRVRQRFPDGIVWLQAGRDVDDARLVAVVNDAVRAVQGAASGYQTVQGAAGELGRALAGRAVLVVLDDAWTPAHLDMLTELPGSVVRLVTTRQPGLLPAGSQSVAVDEMTPDQARAALTSGLPQASFTTAVAARALNAAITATGCWPILLSLLNALLRAAHRHGHDEVAVLERQVARLCARGVGALDRAAEHERRAALSVVIEGNLDQLGADRDLFATLAVFPEDHQIPISVLHRYWTHLAQEHAEHEDGDTGGVCGILDIEDTREVCARFADHSLTTDAALHPDPDPVEGDPQVEGGWIQIHDVIRDYLTHAHPPQALAGRHADLVDAHRDLAPTRGGCTAWAHLPRTQTYWWVWLGYHLHRAGLAGDHELAAILRDPEYLIAALQTTGPAILEEDLLAAANDAQNSKDLAALAGVIRRNNVLEPCDTDQMMTATLESRIRNQPALTELHQQLRALLAAPTLELLDPVPDLPHDCLRRTMTHALNSPFFSVVMAIAPDGSYLVTASSEEARVWDPISGACIHILTGHTNTVLAVAIAPDGSYLITASKDGTARVWDWASGACTHILSAAHTEPVGEVAIAPDGSYLVTANWDGTFQVWDWATGACTHTLTGHTNAVRTVAIAPDGRYLVTVGWDGTARVWDPSTGSCTHTLTGHTDHVNEVAIAPDGKYLVTTSRDGTARVWDPVSGTCTHTLTGHIESVVAVAIAADGSHVVTASYDGTARVWDRASGSCTCI